MAYYEVSDDEHARPRRRRSRSGATLPWMLLVLLLGALAAAGYFFGPKVLALHNALPRARADARREMEQKNIATKRAREAAEALSKERAAWAAERATLGTALESARQKAQQNEQLAQSLRGVLGNGEGELTTEGGRVTLRLVDRVLFRSGEAELTSSGVRVLGRVAAALQRIPNQQVWVQGHTDDAPIRNTELFRSNWELSTARAATVVHYLQGEAGLDPKRLAIVGFGEHRPVSRREQARNRRIEIVLFPENVEVVADAVQPTAPPARSLHASAPSSVP